MGAEHDAWDKAPAEVDALATVAGEAPASGPATAQCPEPVVDALVEMAWAFPNIRVSCARVSSNRVLRFLASAGTQKVGTLVDAVFDIGAVPRVHRLLARGELVQIEDLQRDSRIRETPASLADHRVASMLLLPIASTQGDRLRGAVCFAAARPRTWSHREEAALERVAPLVQLALENMALRDSLDEAQTQLAMSERRSGAIRGVLDSAIHDSRVLVDALIDASSRTPSPKVEDTIRALEHQLFDVLGDLAALPDRIAARRDRESVDLNEFIVASAPVLRAVLHDRFRLFAQTDPLPVWASANRTGLDRMLRALVAHSTRCGSGRDVSLRSYSTPEGARIEISGDAIGTDDRLLSIVSGHLPPSLNDIGVDLWQAHCEALLNNGTIRYFADTTGTKLFIELKTQA